MAWRLKSWKTYPLEKLLLRAHTVHEELLKAVPRISTSARLQSCGYVSVEKKQTFFACANARRTPWSLKKRYFSAPSSHVEQFKLSDIGEGIREVTVKEWFVNVGDNVNQFDNICEVQSDKASVTITSRFSGIIRKRYCEIDEIVSVGNPLCDIEVLDDATESTQEKSKVEPVPDKDASPAISASQVSTTTLETKKVLTTPAVRRLAMENKLQLGAIPGTGKDGRILKEDVLAFIGGKSVPPKKTEIPAGQVPFTVPHAGVGDIVSDKTVPVTGFTRVMVKTMSAALKIPHFVYSDEINVSRLIEVRSKLQPLAKSQGVKLTFLPFFVKAASMAMLEYPVVNSSVDAGCENLTYKAKHNIGVAMDTPAGLAVPNVKHVQSLTLLEVARELNRLHEDGLKGTLKPQDVTGGTFTLSNIGPIGGTYTKPVILPPEVAIGAIGKIQVLPRFDAEGNVVKSSILNISWSADHRILDGATIARFSNLWKQYIEDPTTMLLHLK
ncbi:lipoamide acyltransferase component of branched-chain alpha-keto acid dehydrogenase complex, mitochondrial [Ischnura elegans]|uniref:lipoamide acyltransferase component of branched-chain alpha-keto acid dehydrogenase complex, mitochondrial n=1 Tax=Ischnura elegans TaxID=197161 RepID=UPI001ED8681D|nr:lipoamide acyltransferase component of branched-chain alpha-keto acid dehydrogenase complex, mitochondrial [Ischnura elegans]